MADAVAYRATGKRKTSVARVTLTPGVGKVAVNGFVLSEPSLQNIFIRKVQEGAGS